MSEKNIKYNNNIYVPNINLLVNCGQDRSNHSKLSFKIEKTHLQKMYFNHPFTPTSKTDVPFDRIVSRSGGTENTEIDRNRLNAVQCDIYSVNTKVIGF